MLDEKALAAIEARTNAATQGPWIAVTRDASLGELAYPAHVKRVYTDFDGLCTTDILTILPTVGRLTLRDADTVFIAAARSDIPTLCTALREAQGERARGPSRPIRIGPMNESGLTEQPDGSWSLPCGCTFCYWDGKPKAHLLTPSGYWQYTGKVSPHLQLCAEHAGAAA